MRVLFVVPPLTGHVNPTISVARALEARGHEVAWCAPRHVASALTGAKIFAARAGAKDHADASATREHGAAPPRLFVGDFFRRSPARCRRASRPRRIRADVSRRPAGRRRGLAAPPRPPVGHARDDVGRRHRSAAASHRSSVARELIPGRREAGWHRRGDVTAPVIAFTTSAGAARVPGS
jgi:hypothetical protein